MSGARTGFKIFGIVMMIAFIAVCVYDISRFVEGLLPYAYLALGALALILMTFEKVSWIVSLLNKAAFVIILIELFNMIVFAHNLEFIALASLALITLYLSGFAYVSSIMADPEYAREYLERQDCNIVVKYHHHKLVKYSIPGYNQLIGEIRISDGTKISVYERVPGESGTTWDTVSEKVRFNHLSEAKAFASTLGHITQHVDSTELV